MKILIVEDDKSFGYVLKGELEQAGYDTDLAPDGVEAVLKFLGEQYDFVLLDIRMPRLDGINCLRILRKIRPDIPAIIYSGSAGSGEMAEAVNVGALRCLTKPFAIAYLREEIMKYKSGNLCD